MPLTREQFNELRSSGLTPEQIANFESGYVPANSAPSPPGQVFSQQASTSRAARTIPYLAGAAGGILGGRLGPQGSRLGIAAGETIGAGIAGALSKPLQLALSEQMDQVDVPKAMIGSGLTQAALQAPASAVGVALPFLSRIAGRAAGREEAKIAARAGTREAGLIKSREGVIASELPAKIKQAEQARESASAATEAALKAHPDKIGLDEVASKMAASAKAKYGSRTKPNLGPKLLRKITRRINQMLQDESLGTLRPLQTKSKVLDAAGKPAPIPPAKFSALELNEIKRVAQRYSKGDYAQAAKGVIPNQRLDRVIARNLRQILEEKIPGIDNLNKETQRRINESQSLLKLQASRSAASEATGVKNTARVAAAQFRALNPADTRPAFEIGLLPPRFSVKSPTTLQFLRGAEKAMADKASKTYKTVETITNSPRVVGATLSILKPEEMYNEKYRKKGVSK